MILGNHENFWKRQIMVGVDILKFIVEIVLTEKEDRIKYSRVKLQARRKLYCSLESWTF